MNYSRALPLVGGRNFRDLGGYRADDGRVTRWRTLFRSGALSGLTENDVGALDQLGIRAVFDLRTARERQMEPHPWPRADGVVVHLRDYHASGGELARLLEDPGVTAENARQAMCENYRLLPFEQAEAYGLLYARLADGDLPALFNCTAGKDRTGVAAAILLRLLGVSEDQVLEDYCLTNKYLTFEKLVQKSRDGAEPTESLLDMSVFDALIDAHPDYLSACFDEIDARYGGVEGYAKEGLGLNRGILQSLRQRLLMSV